ncbi:MAG TPA: efflux RND transporter periplasmic adaptor subunit [Usitatibacter sp.]
MSSITATGQRKRWPWIAGVAIIGAALAAWWFASARNQEAKGATRPASNLVVTTRAQSLDWPVRLKANGSVTALQTVDLRAQITSPIAQIHFTEGQNVAKDALLFSLDAREAAANLRKALAQIEKDKYDLATNKRNLERQQDLFRQKFIAQAALDVAQNQVDTLEGQLAVDTAAAEAARVATAYTEIRAPFSGRTGAIGIREGGLAQPGTGTTPGAVLVTVTQIDPIAVTFTLPERELGGLQSALHAGTVAVTAGPQDGSDKFSGKVTFVDNSVDAASGTIKVKAEFANPSGRMWPGQYVNVVLSPRTIAKATVVPAQAVQTGPDSRFMYVVGDDNKVQWTAVKLAYIDNGLAVVDGVAPGTRVVVEGAQNLRPGSVVTEAQRDATKDAKKGEANKEEAKSEGKKAAS